MIINFVYYNIGQDTRKVDKTRDCFTFSSFPSILIRYDSIIYTIIIYKVTKYQYLKTKC